VVFLACMHLTVFLALPLSPGNSLDFYLEANISVSAGIDAYILFSVLALVSEVRWTLSVINCRRSSIADCVWLHPIHTTDYTTSTQTIHSIHRPLNHTIPYVMLL